jgi:two-component system, OmpR family, response regulator
MKVLVVEDEAKVRSFLKKGLEGKEISIDIVSNLDEMFASFLTISYDIIVLDRLLNGIDSLPYIPEIKKKHPKTKVIILSALSEVEEKVEGLGLGADDYLAKPFYISELVARLRVLVRRNEAHDKSDGIVTYDDIEINLNTQRVECSGKRVDLTPKEYKILVLLAKNPDRVFTKIELIDQVWELQHYPESNVVEVAINHLRKKVNEHKEEKIIHSRRNVGYWLGASEL